MDPSEVAKSIVEQSATRSDAVFLAVVVVILCGTIIMGIVFLLVRWMPNLIENFRDEMRIEREYHREQLRQVLAAHEKFEERITRAMNKKT